jgi:hypothetical protein
MPFDMSTPEALVEERTREYYEEYVRRAEAAASTDASAGPAETTPYSYGPPAAASRETNYISDENLLLWLADKQDGLYADLRDRMDSSRARSKAMEDLAHIKQRVERGEMSPAELHAEITALIESYRGTPLEPALEEIFGPKLEELGRALQESSMVGGARQIIDAAALSAAIQSKIDALGRDDELALIEIQSLTADINQAAQLASNLLSSSNQTANAILGNIGR